MLKEKAIENKMLATSFKKGLCPFVRKPADNCFCIKMGSQDIEKTVYFCGQYFEACEIYKTIYLEGNGG